MTNYTRGRRAELLARAACEPLVELAEACIGGGDELQIFEPRVGTLPLEVREPVVRERFLLGDVLAVTAEVELRGGRGWGVRLGDDRVAAVAAAICDAEAEQGGASASAVDRLCAATEAQLRRELAAEWRELSPTIVEFEELM